MLRLLSLAEFVRQQRLGFEGILADPSLAGGQSAAAFVVTANRVGEQARRQIGVITGDAAALGLFVDTGLRLDLASPDVQRPITELRLLVPPAPIPLPGPAPDPGGRVPSFATTAASQP